MLFNVLLGLLAVLGAAVVLATLVLVLGYFWISSRLKRRIAEIRELEYFLASSSNGSKSASERASVREHVPPMEIRMVREQDESQDQLIRRIDAWLVEHNFTALGSFLIQPIGERLFVYLNADRTLVGAIREANRPDRMHVEFCFDLGDGERGGVSNPPVDVLPLPEDAVGHFVCKSIRDDFSVLSQLWLEAVELLERPDIVDRLVKVTPTEISHFYEDAHRNEMRDRIRTGVSERELLASFAAQGVEPSAGDIAEIQAAWQLAMQDHLIDCSPRALRHYQQGIEVLAVCDNSLSDFLVERMGRFLTAHQEYEGMDVAARLHELQLLLSLFSPRDALARFRPLLPQSLRYNLVDQVQQPLPIDYYGLPKG